MAVRDIAGNAKTKNLLLLFAGEKRSGVSYMFLGEENTGKTFAAIQFAKVLNCSNTSGDGDCCDSCDNCRLLDRVLIDLDEGGMQKHVHPDIRFISTDKAQLSIDLVRDSLKEINSYKAVKLAKKIVVIKDADRLNKASSNSILKELEEPGADVVIMLIVNNLENILQTIVSRCRRVDLKRASYGEIEKVLTAAFPSMPPETVKRAVEFSGGRIGDAIRFDDMKDSVADVVAAFKTLAGRKDDIEGIFDNIKSIEDSYRKAQQKEKKEKISGRARLFLVDRLKILSNIYRDMFVEKMQVKSVMKNKYGIDAGELKDMNGPSIVRVMRMIESAQRDLLLNANVSILVNDLFFRIRKEGITK